MDFFYPFIISFILVFISELGDKTQLLVLSFSSKLKVHVILFGIALGSFFSHGIAILFGSFLGGIDSAFFQFTLKLFTYFSFVIFGIFTLRSNNKISKNEKSSNTYISTALSYVLLIAFSIAVGELGDKTFLASIGLGIQYPLYKISLIVGAILGMLASDLIAIIFGKIIGKKIPQNTMQKFSGILFLIFGFIGILNFIF